MLNDADNQKNMQKNVFMMINQCELISESSELQIRRKSIAQAFLSEYINHWGTFKCNNSTTASKRRSSFWQKSAFRMGSSFNVLVNCTLDLAFPSLAAAIAFGESDLAHGNLVFAMHKKVECSASKWFASTYSFLKMPHGEKEMYQCADLAFDFGHQSIKCVSSGVYQTKHCERYALWSTFTFVNVEAENFNGLATQMSISMDTRTTKQFNLSSILHKIHIKFAYDETHSKALCQWVVWWCRRVNSYNFFVI